MLNHINKACTLVLLFISTLAIAQPRGAKPVANTATFQTKLKAANSKVSSITCDFKQDKKLELLEENIISSGKFYFKKEQKVRIEYTKPYSYLVVMDGSKLTIKDEQKVSRINTRGSKLMQSVNRIMVDCMQGTVMDNPDFDTKLYTYKDRYELVMHPKDNEMKTLYERIEVSLMMSNFNVYRISMFEQGGDATVMTFTNIKQNATLDDKVFKVK